MSKSTYEIRQTFLEFFKSKGHKILESSSLIPDNDNTLLFTNAGMNQFKNIFLGLENPEYKRVSTSQKCIRAGGKNNDLENVGYTSCHHTFFEMLGNFSFGDYFKYDAIQFSWELLTSKHWFNLSKDKLWITVYANDDETYKIWTEKIGVSTNKVSRIGDINGVSDNFWKMGDTGPCGPSSEIFFDYGQENKNNKKENFKNRYIEIWNLVFMQFNLQNNGKLIPLPKLSVDTGMGLERITTVIQNVKSNYDIDIFKQIIKLIIQITETTNYNNYSLRVIADHIRACIFLINDGVIPSNEGRGYVLRKIIRRAILHGNKLDVKNIFLYKLIQPIINIIGNIYIKNKEKQYIIENIIRIEEEKFHNTLKKGLFLLNKEIDKLSGNTLNGKIAFRLYDTYGFPFDLTYDICKERNLFLDKKEFEKNIKLQRNMSKHCNIFKKKYNNLSLLSIDKPTQFLGYKNTTNNAIIMYIFINNESVKSIFKNQEAIIVLNKTSFYSEAGGQIGDEGNITSNLAYFKVNDTQKYGKLIGHIGKVIFGNFNVGTKVIANINKDKRNCISLNHSATHLLHATLRYILNEEVYQKGSMIHNKYLRFDFSYNQPINNILINKIETIINDKIRQNLKIKTEILSLKNAYKKTNISLFKNKYTSKVRLLNIGNFSKEICCGTHVKRTGDIGTFNIITEFGISANIRRIEAVTGESAILFIQNNKNIIFEINKLVKGNNNNVIEKINILKNKYSKLEKKIFFFKNNQILQLSNLICKNIYEINGTNIIIHKLYNIEKEILYKIINILKNKFKSTIIILCNLLNNQLYLITGVTKNLINIINACEIINFLIKTLGGKGGGCSDLAQAICGNKISISKALNNVKNMILEKLKKKK